MKFFTAIVLNQSLDHFRAARNMQPFPWLNPCDRYSKNLMPKLYSVSTGKYSTVSLQHRSAGFTLQKERTQRIGKTCVDQLTTQKQFNKEHYIMNEQEPYRDPYNMAVPPTSPLAIVSVIAGIIGFSAMPVVGGIVALITGYMARKETRATPPTASGDGLALAGIIMGWLQIGLAVVGICCFAASFIFAFIPVVLNQ
jgi:hypothetical protein